MASAGPKAGAAAAAAASAAAPKLYSEEDVAALVRSLDRAEDHHIFAVDVLVTYPYLAESYTKVCPRRCDLATAAQKALDGAYSHDVRLEGLRADIALMASNCVAYNGPTSAYAETATRFERHALEQLDAFVVAHNGGRRVSRLRLPTAAAASVTSEAAPTKKRAAPAVAASPAVPTTREVAALVDSLDRREDGGAFSVDVAEAYPDLRDSYRKACPNPMNLRLMHQRAKEGFYTADAATVFGDSVAASLPRLREDIELLVRNCVTFNAKVETWVALARSFRAFAHRRVDDFVLRHAAALRGTRSGAEAYESADTATVVEGTTAEAPAPPAPAASSSAAASAAAASAPAAVPARKRERQEGHASGPVVHVVPEVAPQVCPTPLQPGLAVPPLLRRRLALDHVRHARLPLRRVGVALPYDCVFPPATGESGRGAAAVTLDTATSAGHVLQLLRESVVKFFAAQRSGTDFTDAFAYSMREEQLYLGVLDVAAAKYRETAPHLVLYETEAAELQEWMALRALSRGAQTPAPIAAGSSEAVAEELHYLYLVRFLVHWPQLAALCCTTATAATADQRRAAPGSLRISRDQLKAVAQVARITQEFLLVIEAVEERLRHEAP